MPNTQTMKFSVKELKECLYYKRSCKILRTCGIMTLCVGFLVCAVGYRGWILEVFSSDKIIKLVGIYLVIFGGLQITKPAKGVWLLVSGVCLVILGIFFVVSFMVALSALPDPFQVARKKGGAFVPMLILIGSGVFNIVLFKRFSGTPMNMPPDDAIKYMDELVRFINETNANENSVIVEFTAEAEVWKIMLMQESAVFVKGKGEERFGDKTAIEVASKDEVDYVKRGEIVIGKPIKVCFRVGKRKINSAIEPDLFARFEAWKTSLKASL